MLRLLMTSIALGFLVQSIDASEIDAARQEPTGTSEAIQEPPDSSFHASMNLDLAAARAATSARQQALIAHVQCIVGVMDGDPSLLPTARTACASTRAAYTSKLAAPVAELDMSIQEERIAAHLRSLPNKD